MTNNYTGGCDCEAEQDILDIYDEDITDTDLERGFIMAVCKCKCKLCGNVYLTELRLDTPMSDPGDYNEDDDDTPEWMNDGI